MILSEIIKNKESYLKFIKPSVEFWTLHTAEVQVSIFFEFAKRNGITVLSVDAVTEWINALVEAKRASGTIENYVMRLIQFLRWCAERRIIEFNPITFKALPKWKTTQRRKKQIVTEDHYRKLITDLRNRCDTNWHDAITVGRYTGLRISDVCLLQKSWTDWTKETLELTPLKTRKFNKRVVIPMRAELFEVIKRRFDDKHGAYTFPGHEDYFFGEFHLSYMSDRGASLRVQFKYRLRRAGVPTYYSFHCLRHTFISRMANADVSYKVIQSITGQRIEQIAEYHQVDLQAQRAAIMKA